MTQRSYPWTFLPEGKSDPASVEGSGITRAEASPSSWLAELAGGILAIGEAPAWAAPDVLNADARCFRALETQGGYEAVWRGALAVALLWDAWAHEREGARLELIRLDDEEAGFTGSVLQAMAGRSHALTLLALENGRHDRAPLGFLSKKTLVTPAANLTGLGSLLPARASWYDAARGTLADPCDYVNDQDRVLLTGMLMQLHVQVSSANPVLAGAIGRFLTALETSRAVRAERAEKLRQADVTMLETHLLIAAGLQPEDSFTMLSVRQDGYTQGENRILSALGAAHAAEAGGNQVVWLWRGRPFMRLDAQLGLERIPGAAAESAVAEMTAELDRLLCNSPAWCARTARRLQPMLAESGVEALRKVGEGLLTRLTQLMHASGEEAVLTYPWPEDSGAARLLIAESLGEGWEAALTPFADKLALVDAQAVSALGMQSLQLQGDGTVPGEMTEFAAIPPLSAKMAQKLAARDERGSVLLMDGVQMLCHADASGAAGVTAQYAVQGARRLVLRRRYDEADIVSLEEDETPTVAVWPSIPLSASGWRSYYVYANCGDVQVEALERGSWKRGEMRQAADDPQVSWSVLHTEEYPACLLMRMGESCLGALPNLLPDFRAPVRPHAVIALDVGASGTAVAISQGADAVPLYCASTRRILLQGANRTLPDYAFVDGGAVQPVFNSAVETFADGREAWRKPVMDAHIATQSPFSERAKANSSRVHWGLKWGYGEDSAALRKQYLGNLMQTAVQTAVTMGSTSVSWRISMPADMAGEGKKSLLRTMQELAGEIAQLTGIPLTEGIPPVSWADESVAVGHYFRKLSRQPVHGGFMSLDIGGGSSKLMLWLRGMPQPSFTLSLPLGAQHMLLEAMLANPNCLAEDFARVADDGLQERLRQLTEQFTRARTDVRALEMARYMLDELLAHDLRQLHQYMNSMYTQGTCSRTQALLLLQVSFLMMLAGTVQEQVYRDATLNDLLPPYMEICLAGRGAQLMYGFNTALQRRLSGFVRLPMAREHPTREFAFIPSDAMKLEAALGLARLTETETGDPGDYIPPARRFARAIDPVEMLRRYLWHFRMELPLAAMRLFPGAYDAQGGLTQAADARLRACAANAFAGQGDSVEQNCAAWLVTLLQWMA